MIDSRFYMQVYLNAWSKFLDIMVVLFEKSMSVFLYHLGVSVFVGKKVEVSLRLFDIFERNRVFIFLWGSFGTP